MMTATSMLPSGKFAGACRNRNTAPTATFMPSVFMISASINETSRTSPVALRRNTPVVPPFPIVTAVLMTLLSSLLPLSGAHQMNDTVLTMKAFDGEAEAIRSIDHARKLDGAVRLVVGRAFDLEGGCAGDQPEQLRLLLAANHLDGAGCPGGHNAVERLHRPIEGAIRQVRLQDFAKRLGGEVGIEQRGGLAVHRCQPADEQELALPGVERLADHRVCGDQSPEPNVDVRLDAFGAHALGEAREDRDLLIDLRLLDEGPAAARPVQVALFDEVEDGLANRGQADPELIGVLALAQQFLTLAELAPLDPAQQVRPELRMERNRRRATDNRLMVPHQRPLAHAHGLSAFLAD